MREVRDTKGAIIYRIDNDRIIAETPTDMSTLHQTIREGKIFINKAKKKLGAN